MIDDRIYAYISSINEELKELLKTLCTIPAPSNHEDERARFVFEWLQNLGAYDTYIDPAMNVVLPINCRDKNDIVVFMAHTDTVFPDVTPFEYKVSGNIAQCPGICDDTVDLAMMLMVIKYVVKNKLTPTRGVLFVANSGEEGLGNLKGTREIMDVYGDKISEFYTFDGHYNALVNRCVGSHRYEITIHAQGGHAYNNFGNTSAIMQLSELICKLYSLEPPKQDGSSVSYNVGKIGGGTSINSIAETACMLYEYRSNDEVCLSKMRDLFLDTIDIQRKKGVNIDVKMLGERPCMQGVDKEKLEQLSYKCIEICQRHSGIPCKQNSGSTDANLPMSRGIPAVCVGVYDGGGMHTRAEWLNLDSLPVGMKIEAELILEYFEQKKII